MEGDNSSSESSVDSIVKISTKKRKQSSSHKGDKIYMIKEAQTTQKSLALEDMEDDNPDSESLVEITVENSNKKVKKSSSHEGDKIFHSFTDDNESEEFEEQDYLQTVKKTSSLKNKFSKLQSPSFQGYKSGHSSTQSLMKEAQTTQTPRVGSQQIVSHKTRNRRQTSEELGYRILLKETKALRVDIQGVSKVQQEILKIMEADRSAMYAGKKSFEEEYTLKLPLNNQQELKNLDRELQNNKDCCCRFRAAVNLSMSLDAGLRKSLNIIIKKYLDRYLILQLTAVKKVPGKEVFKEFKIYSCLQAVASEKFLAAKEEVAAQIGTIFCNAKDWGGNRQARRGNIEK